MKRRSASPGARYGVELQGVQSHAEADNLRCVLDALEGRDGTVRVIDRQRPGVAFEGTIQEVQEAILRHGASSPKEAG